MWNQTKYDALCAARELAKADGVLLLVFGGEDGNDFSCQVANAELLLEIPRLLREMADQIENGGPGDAA